MSVFADLESREKEAPIPPPAPIPSHVAIIMDGNRRWAEQRGLPPMMGHWEGAEVLTDIVKGASEMGVQTLTVYSFSTENWRRPRDEVEALMEIFEFYLCRKKEGMVKDGVKLSAIGEVSHLPPAVKKALFETQEATKNGSKINLVLALNYGARDEICRAFRKILKENQGILPDAIDEDLISKHLDTACWKDPELLIRTSGELRLSNFLLWQMSYAEMYMTDVLWPEFSMEHFQRAITSFQGRSRRQGGNGCKI